MNGKCNWSPGLRPGAGHSAADRGGAGRGAPGAHQKLIQIPPTSPGAGTTGSGRAGASSLFPSGFHADVGVHGVTTGGAGGYDCIPKPSCGRECQRAPCAQEQLSSVLHGGCDSITVTTCHHLEKPLERAGETPTFVAAARQERSWHQLHRCE